MEHYREDVRELNQSEIEHVAGAGVPALVVPAIIWGSRAYKAYKAAKTAAKGAAIAGGAAAGKGLVDGFADGVSGE